MQPFTVLSGRAAPLPRANIDTDVIMPKQFLKGIDRKGLGAGAFHDLRFAAAGEPNRDFVLNRPGWEDAAFLVVGPNFGCGSSREHAVWGLQQLGVRALIGSSFGGIFFDNCARNGVLAITLSDADVDALMALAGNPATNTMSVDLPAQQIRAPAAGLAVGFDIDQRRKDALVRGLDAIGQALEMAPQIRAFEAARLDEEPWLAAGVCASV